MKRASKRCSARLGRSGRRRGALCGRRGCLPCANNRGRRRFGLGGAGCGCRDLCGRHSCLLRANNGRRRGSRLWCGALHGRCGGLFSPNNFWRRRFWFWGAGRGREGCTLGRRRGYFLRSNRFGRRRLKLGGDDYRRVGLFLPQHGRLAHFRILGHALGNFTLNRYDFGAAVQDYSFRFATVFRRRRMGRLLFLNYDLGALRIFFRQSRPGVAQVKQ